MEWTKERLAALSLSQRETLYKNARRQTSKTATQLTKMIEEAGLPFSEAKCPTEDDPLTLAIYDVINSAEGRAAIIDAVENGLPPLGAVDPLLFGKLGVDYGAHNMTTATAGSMIAELLRSFGYKEMGKSTPLPPGSIAKTGQMWASRKAKAKITADAS